jgi:hypothetical protein
MTNRRTSLATLAAPGLRGVACHLLAALLLLAGGPAAWGAAPRGGDGAPGLGAPDDHPALVSGRRPDAQVGRPAEAPRSSAPLAALLAAAAELAPPAARRASHDELPPRGTRSATVSTRNTRGPPSGDR